MTFAQLQSALKLLREQGIVAKSFRLTQRKDILQAEYDRVMAEQPQPQEPESKADNCDHELQTLRAKVAELEQLLSIAKQTIAVQQQTIDNQERRLDEYAAQAQEQENAKDWAEHEEEYEQAYENWKQEQAQEVIKQEFKDAISVDSEIAQVAEEVEQAIATSGLKKAKTIVKKFRAKIHPDTCSQYGREFSQDKWERMTAVVEFYFSEQEN